MTATDGPGPDGGGLRPMLLAVAPTGARRGKADHPRLPITPAELAECAAACRDAGAAMFHLHVRDSAGRHSLDPDAYRAATAAIRGAVGSAMIVQMTTEAVGRYRPAEQMAAVRAVAPEAVSIALRELLSDEEGLPLAAEFLAEQTRAGVLVQYILFDRDDLVRFDELERRGVIPDQGRSLLFVLGRYSEGQRSAPGDLLPFLQGPVGTRSWMLCAFGPRESACMLAAVAFDGHARIGFENNLYLPDGTLAPDNAALVALVRRHVEAIARPLADADAGRRILAGRE